jgi:serine/threonine protein kinase/Tol biopolymer transport system component
MTLSPGQRLGPYEILAVLGAGGMGQVFRGRDHALQRDAAIKVLPDAFARNAVSVARFKREAQVLASLNHPNIAAIYGLHESDGVLALALELVEGEDLSERLKRGPLPMAEALDVARQVAAALDEAHENGIVHRDLKPGNIRITDKGNVKVLDFGLAQTRTDAETTREEKTVTRALTDPGVVMGTPAYMSPEQARGKPLGKRTDIWSFGATLYRMLAGKRPFEGATPSDVIASILTTEPDWSALPATTPGPVRDLLRACLERDPRDRLRDIGDARHALTQSSSSRTIATPPIPIAAETSVPPPAARSRGLAVPLVLGLAAGAVVFAGLSWLRSRGVAEPEPIRVSINPPTGVTLAVGRGSSVAVSPDGRFLVFVGRAQNKTQLYKRPLAEFTATPIEGTEGATNPFFSPDGHWVAFFADERLKKVSMDGGAPVVLGEVLNARGEAWGQDDRIYVTRTNGSGVSRISAAGGAFENVTKLAQREFSHRWPRVLPSGALLYAVWNDTGWESSRIHGLKSPGTGGEPQVVVPTGGGYPHFVRDAARGVSYLLYARAEGLLAARFDDARLEVTGQAIPVVDGVLTNLSGGAHFDLSRSGVLAYMPGSTSEAARPVDWVTIDGNAAPAGTLANSGRFFALAPDGVSVIGVSASDRRGLWVQTLATGAVRYLANEDQSYNPRVSADGAYLFYARGIPTLNVWRRRLDGNSAEERLTNTQRSQFIDAVSPDGRTVMFQELSEQGGSDLLTMEIPPDYTAGAALKPPIPFVASAAFEQSPRFSPDGKWVVYMSNDSGRFEVFVKSFPATDSRVQVSTGGGFNPVFSPDGRTIFYRSLKGTMIAAPYEVKGAELKLGAERVLFDASKYEIRYEISPDGKRFLMMPLQATEAAATQIQVVLNFAEELRRKVR